MERTLDETKASLIENINKRVTDKVIEKQNGDTLIRFINTAQTIDDANFIYTVGTKYKSTGFHFDFRKDKIDNDTIYYFQKNQKLSFQPTNKNGLTHKLIIGDNYKALLNLLIEYRGKIDVIYIDPPYGVNSMGDFAKTNYENNISRDNLLSMLQTRLLLARELLSDTGVIFCSIDDKNQAYIKCLFDDVFGEENFLLNICVKRASEIASNFTVSQHEYVLCYTKDTKKYELKTHEKFTYSRGTVGNQDQTMPIITFPAGIKCFNLADGTYNKTRQVADSNENVENFTPIIIKNGVLQAPIKLKARWRSSNDMRNFFKNNCQPTQAKINGEIVDIYFENDRFIPIIKKQTYEKIPSLFLENNRGSKFLEDIDMTGVFSFPKSVALLEQLLSFAPNNALILDFFAGSGTTGQAVMELNKEDGGRRQFILVQLDEKLDVAKASQTEKPIIKNAIELLSEQELPSNLASLTNERLRRVMTGKTNDGSADFKWLKDNTPYGDGLDVYNIASVSAMANQLGQMPFDVINETLYGKEKLNINDKIDWVCSKFEMTNKKVESDKDWEARVRGQKDVK